ncbi:MAG: YceI family protein [Cyclobacteriaceae bacterium]
MMNQNRFIEHFFLFLFILSFSCSFAQTQYRQSDDSYLSISGSSTLNAWTMNSDEGNYKVELETTDEGLPIKLNSLSLNVPCESLKSGHSAMDKNAYSALDADSHKSIIFILTSSKLHSRKIDCTGNLSVAGKTKLISVETEYLPLENQALLFTGKKKLKMSDFDIEPPSFMFGTVSTADEITVSFYIKLIPTTK